jgi:MFS transporter, YQGE family, putative transporter
MTDESGIGQHEPTDVAIAAEQSGPGKLTSGEVHLIQVQGMYQAANAIAGIFLSLYLFQVGGFRSVCLFYATNYTVQTFAFAANGRLLYKYRTHQLARIGLSLLCLVFLLLLVLGDNAVHYVVLIGALAGIGDGFYWSNINTSEYVVTHEHSRNRYYSRLFFTNSLGSVAGPPIAGIILTVFGDDATLRGGYYVLFGMLVLAWALTQFHARGMSSLSGSEFRLDDLRQPRSLEWNLIVLQNFLRGLWIQPLISFSAVLLFLIVDSELTLSIVSVCTTVLTGLFSFAVGHQLQKYPRTYWLGALVVPVGMIGFALQQNWFGIFCWAILVQCFDLYANTSTFKVMYDWMDRTGKPWTRLYHLVLEREAALNIGRLIGFGAVYLALAGGNEETVVATGVGLAAVFPLLTGIVHAVLMRRGAGSPASS